MGWPGNTSCSEADNLHHDTQSLPEDVERHLQSCRPMVVNNVYIKAQLAAIDELCENARPLISPTADDVNNLEALYEFKDVYLARAGALVITPESKQKLDDTFSYYCHMLDVKWENPTNTKFRELHGAAFTRQAEPNPPSTKDWSQASSDDVAKHIRKQKKAQKAAKRILDLAKNEGLSAHRITLRDLRIAKSTAYRIIKEAKSKCPGFLPE